jgi:hypothetical protein
MRRSRVQLLVAAPNVGRCCGTVHVSACADWNSASRRRITFIDKVWGRRQNSASLLGGVPERSKGSDCKSDGAAFVGSNPTPSTMCSVQTEVGRTTRASRESGAMRGGYSSVAEPQPSKLMARVRFPLPAPSSGYSAKNKSVLPIGRRITGSHSSVGRALPW